MGHRVRGDDRHAIHQAVNVNPPGFDELTQGNPLLAAYPNNTLNNNVEQFEETFDVTTDASGNFHVQVAELKDFPVRVCLGTIGGVTGTGAASSGWLNVIGTTDKAIMGAWRIVGTYASFQLTEKQDDRSGVLLGHDQLLGNPELWDSPADFRALKQTEEVPAIAGIGVSCKHGPITAFLGSVSLLTLSVTGDAQSIGNNGLYCLNMDPHAYKLSIKNNAGRDTLDGSNYVVQRQVDGLGNVETENFYVADMVFNCGIFGTGMTPSTKVGVLKVVQIIDYLPVPSSRFYSPCTVAAPPAPLVSLGDKKSTKATLQGAALSVIDMFEDAASANPGALLADVRSSWSAALDYGKSVWSGIDRFQKRARTLYEDYSPMATEALAYGAMLL